MPKSPPLPTTETESTTGAPPAGWIPTRAKAAKIAALYALLGAFWVLGSGWMLHHFVANESIEAVLETVKGWFYVVVTALLLGWALDRYFFQIRRAALQLQESERLQALSSEVLKILNETQALPETTQRILQAIKRDTAIECVGIRLRKDNDFPYAASEGFSSEFIEKENRLAARTPEGEFCVDDKGNFRLECTCGLVLSGQTDPLNPLFTQGGSAWTNDSRLLLQVPPEQDPRQHPRNRCIHEGYQSVALVPIRVKGEIIGLLQLNDRRKGCFTPEMIQYFEGLAESFGVALQRLKQDEITRDSQRSLRALLDAIPESVFMMNLDGSILAANSGFAARFDVPLDRCVGSNLFHLVPSEVVDSRRTWVNEVVRTRRPVVHEEAWKEKWLRLHYAPVGGPDGRVGRIVGLEVDITEHRQAEVLLQERLHLQDQLSKIAATVPGMICSFRLRPDGSSCMPFTTEVITDLYGLQPSDVRDDFSPILGLVHLEDRAQLQASISASARTMAPWRDSFRVIHPQKGERWIEGHSVPQLESDGSILWHGFVQDITERKRLEQEREAALVKYRTLFDTLPVGVTVADHAGRIVESNRMAERILELRLEKQLERTIDESAWRIVHSDWTPMHPDEFASVRALREQRLVEHVEMGLVKSESKTTWISVNAAPLPLKDFGVVITYSDIGAKKRAEEALRASEERFRAYIEQAADAVFVHDFEGNFISVNQQACTTLGYSREELLGMRVPDVDLSFRLAEAKELWGQVTPGEPLTLQGRHRRKDGTDFPVEIRFGCFDLEEKRYFLALVRDVTERDRAQAALREREEIFSSIVGQALDAIGLVDATTGRVVEFNAAAHEGLGYTREEFASLAVSDFQAEMSIERIQQALQKSADEGGLVFETVHRHRDGSPRDARVSLRSLRIRDHDYLAAVWTDITDRKSQEEVDRLHLRALQLLAAGAPLSEVLDAMVQLLECRRPEWRGSIMLLDNAGAHLVWGAAPRLPQAYKDAINNLAISPTAGSCGAAAATGQIMVAHDIETHPNWTAYRDVARNAGIRACWSVPIISATSEVLGVLTVYHQTPSTPTAEQLHSIERVKDLASVAIGQRRAERTLRENESRLETLFEHSPVAIWEQDFSEVKVRLDALTRAGSADLGKYLRQNHTELTRCAAAVKSLRANHNSLTLFRAEDHESPRDLPAFFTDTTLDVFADTLAVLASGTRHWEGDLPLKRPGRDDGIFSVSLTLVPSHEEPWSSVLVSFSDITERRRMEEALRTREAEFRGMFEVASIGMAQAEPSTGRWLRVNQRMCLITGYSVGELLQMNVPEITHPDDRERDWNLFQNVIRGGAPEYSIEKRYIRKDGTHIWVHVNMTVVRDVQGNPIQTMATIEDISERKRAEAQSARDALRTEFLLELHQRASHLSDREIFDYVLDRAVDLTESTVGCYHLISEDQKTILSTAWLDLASGKGVLTSEQPLPLEQDGPWFECVRLHRPVVYSEPVSPSSGSMLAPELRRLMSIPLVEQGKVQLILAVGNKATYYRETDLVQLQLVANELLMLMTQRTAQKQVRQLSRAVEQIPASVVITDLKGAIEYVNPKFTEVSGYTLGEVRGLNPRVLKSGQMPADHYQRLWRTLGAGHEWHGELHNKKKNGELHWESVSIFPITDPAGQITNFVAVKEDVTQRKRLEALRAALLTLGQQLNITRDALGMGRALLKVADQLWNFHAATLHLLTSDNRKARAIITVDTIDGERRELPNSAHSELSPRMKRVLETGAELILRDVAATQTDSHLLGDPTHLSASIMCVPIRRDVTVVGVLSVQSYTPRAYSREDLETLQVLADYCAGALDRIASEQALRHSELRYRDLVETTFDWVWELNAEARYTYSSPKIENLLGYKVSEVLGRTPFDLMPTEEAQRIEKIFKDIASQSQPFQGLENTNLHKSGRLVVLETSAVPVLGLSGELIGYRGMGRDITERKHLEAQLRQAQKLEAIGQLAGGVAHDFNNILAAFMMQLDLLKLSARVEKEIHPVLDDLSAGAFRAANLTRQLLMFSRRAVMAMKPLDLNEVIANLLKMLGRLIGEHIALQFAPATSLPAVEADAGMLEQVLMNLVVNARDAMPKGGRITIATAAATLKSEDTWSNPQRRLGRFACLSVEDTGTGMDSATVQRIFEPFFTTKEPGKGTGLGLATVHGIVAQHKGWIEVQSELGVGTVFRVYLPVLAEAALATRQSIQSEPAPRGRETILLVEDEAKVRRPVGEMLRVLGYRVLEASNGREAMDLWQSHGHEVDVLFTDMVMPEGVTGLELVEKLQAMKPGLKAILSSGYNAEIVQSGVLRKPGLLYLPKPYEGRILAKAVRKCLDAGSGELP